MCVYSRLLYKGAVAVHQRQGGDWCLWINYVSLFRVDCLPQGDRFIWIIWALFHVMDAMFLRGWLDC